MGKYRLQGKSLKNLKEAVLQRQYFRTENGKMEAIVALWKLSGKEKKRQERHI